MRHFLRIWLYCFKKVLNCDLKTLSSQNMTIGIKKVRIFRRFRNRWKKREILLTKKLWYWPLKCRKGGVFPISDWQKLVVRIWTFFGCNLLNYLTNFKLAYNSVLSVYPHAKIENKKTLGLSQLSNFLYLRMQFAWNGLFLRKTF